MNWKAWATVFGLIFSIIGVVGFSLKDVIIAQYFPEQAPTTKEDIATIEDSLETTAIAAQEAQKVVVENQERTAEAVETLEEAAQTLKELMDLQIRQAETADLQLDLIQEAEYEYSVKSVIESDDPRTADARAALMNQDTTIAAASLVELAQSQEQDDNSPDEVAAETWRKAAALLYTIDPAEAATAYFKASELSENSRRYDALANTAIENERRRRASADAPGTNLLVDEYVGPVKKFEESIVADQISFTPLNCRADDMTLACTIQVVKESPRSKVAIESIALVDDWARAFTPTSVSIANRNDRGRNTFPTLEPGSHELLLKFEGVPGGSNYGLEFTINKAHRLRWRGLPTENLSTTLRDAWGGPLGIASFVAINEQETLSPYGLKLTACERLGRRLACFGEIGYEGPKHKAQIRNLRLTDTAGRVYDPSGVRFADRTDNGANSYPQLQTGNFSFQINFWKTPVDETFVLSGEIGEQGFAFSSFSTNESDPDVRERLDYFWTWPPRVTLEDSIRLRDFLVEPRSCARSGYSAVCEIDVSYIGPKRKIGFTNIAIFDHEGNRYTPSKVSIAGRNDNGTNTYPTLIAGSHKFLAEFESLPTSRLYELEMTIDESIFLVVDRLSLPGEDGAMGLPGDIVYSSIESRGNSGPAVISTHGCSRRTSSLVCYLQVEYDGPKKKMNITDIAITSPGGEAVVPSRVQIANRSDRGGSTYPTLESGAYPMVVKFEDVGESGSFEFSLKVNDGVPYNWSREID